MAQSFPRDAVKHVIHAAEKLMEDHMAKYDPSHDAYHVQRVRKTALTLANSLTPQPDLLVVELAALLHDILDKKYASPELARYPLAFFTPFFESVKSHVDLISSGKGALIAKIIENVSWNTEKKLRAEGKITGWHETCVELHCVQDADRLDAIGAFGIMRCAAYSCAVARPLYVPPESSQYDGTAVGHFHEKLLKIKDHLKTEPGKKLGKERHEFMLSFLSTLDREYAVVRNTLTLQGDESCELF